MDTARMKPSCPDPIRAPTHSRRVLWCEAETWMAGPSPAMIKRVDRTSRPRALGHRSPLPLALPQAQLLNFRAASALTQSLLFGHQSRFRRDNAAWDVQPEYRDHRGN